MCFELSSPQDLYYQEQILMSRLLLKLFLLIFVYPYRRDFISVLEVAVSLNLENIDRTKADILSGDNMEEVRTFSAIAHEDDILQTYLKEIGKIKLLKSWEEKEPCLIYPYLYILHVNLTEDRKTALVSLQRTHGYEFIFKDIAIPFE